MAKETERKSAKQDTGDGSADELRTLLDERRLKFEAAARQFQMPPAAKRRLAELQGLLLECCRITFDATGVKYPEGRERDFAQCLAQLNIAMITKYAKGMISHHDDGDITWMDLMKEAEAEVMDLLTYLMARKWALA